jgi:hypothetical protein
MAFTIDTKANIGFKKSVGVAQTTNVKEFFNEEYSSRFLVSAGDIWGKKITPTMTVATAVTDGLVGNATRVDLELKPIPTTLVSGKYAAYSLYVPAGAVPAGLSGKINPLTGIAYAVGDRVTGVILENYSNANFRPHLFSDHAKTTEIYPLDACDWIVDPVAGILAQEGDPVGNMVNFGSDLSDTSQNGVLSCYVYVGPTAQESTGGAAALTMDDTYNNSTADGYAVIADNGMFWKLSNTKDFQVTESNGSTNIFKVTAVSGGPDTMTVNAAQTATGDLHLTGELHVVASGSGDSITLNAGSNALDVDAGTSTITTGTLAVVSTGASSWEVTTGSLGLSTTTSGNITVNSAGTLGLDGIGASHLTISTGTLTISTTTSGDVALNSAADITFNDSRTAAIPFSQTNASALSSNFAYDIQTDFDWTRPSPGTGTAAITSIMGAVNANRDDLTEYVELIKTQGVAVGTAGGANLIGVDGITGVIPTGKSLAANSNLQEMLEGIAMGAGGGKYYAAIGDFTTAKAAATYYKANEIVYIGDTNRFVQVITQTTSITETTDWKYLWDNEAIGANSTSNQNFKVDISAGTGGIQLKSAAGTVEVTTTGTLDMNAGTMTLDTTGTFSIDGVGGSNVTTDAGQLQLSTTTSGEIDITAAGAVDINAGAAVTIDAAAANNITLTTTSTGITNLVSADTVKLDGGHIDINAGTGKIITADSDTSATFTAPTIELAGSTVVDLDGGAIEIDGTLASNFTVAGYDLTLSTTTAGSVNVTAFDNIIGSSKKTQFTTSSAAADSFKVDSTGGIDIDTPSGKTVNIDQAGGGYIYLTAGGQLSAGSYSSNATISGDSYLNLYANTGKILIQDVQNTAADAIKINAQAGGVEIDAAVNKDVTINTTGTGKVDINGAATIELDSPRVNIAGDTYVAADKKLYVDQINITSVDPSDTATISGRRTGNASAANLLRNTGFELGTAGDADEWTEASGAVRTQAQHFYNDWSLGFTGTALATPVDIVTQSLTGLTAASNHTISLYAMGTNSGAISIQMPGGTITEIIPAGTNPSAWTRYTVNVTNNTATGNFKIIADGTGAENYAIYIDAVMAERKATGAATAYFSGYSSDMMLTIGNEADDRIVLRTFDGGSNFTDLFTVFQDTVRVYGDLVVDGTTTTVNSNNVNIGDNMQTWNADITSSALNSDAFLQIKRLVNAGATGTIQSLTLTGTTGGGSAQHEIALNTGEGTAWAANDYLEIYGATDNDNDGLYRVASKSSDILILDKVYNTLSAAQAGVAGNIRQADPAIIRWNESTDTFQVLNFASGNFENVATTTGTGATSLDTAYDGGSSVTVDDTSVAWTLSASKYFEVVDGTDTAKFKVTAGTAADSVNVDTSGGMNIDTKQGFSLDDDSGAYLHISTVGRIELYSASNQLLSLDSQGSGNVEIGAVGTGKVLVASVSSTAADAIKLESQQGGIALVTDDATKSLTLDSGSFSIDGVLASNVTVTSTTSQALTLSTVTSGNLNVSAAGVLNMDGNSVTVDAVSGQNITATVAGVGTIDLVSAADVNVDALTLDLNGNYDQSGNYTFKIDTSATGADSVEIITAGGFDVDAVSFEIDGTATSRISTTAAGLTLSTLTSGTLTVDAVATLDMNAVAATLDASGGFSIDGTGAASNVSSTGQNLTVSTLTSGTLTVDAVATLDMNAVAATLDASGGFSIDGTGAASNVSSTGQTLTISTVTAGTLLAITSAGSIQTNADAASYVNVNGYNLTLKTTSAGNVVLQSAGTLTFADAIASTAIPFSQTNAGTLVSEFAYDTQTDFNWTRPGLGTAAITSIMGAVDANRLDISEYVELVRTEGAAIGTAAGANLIGVDGIAGVIPAGKLVGEDANLQQMLEGMVVSSGGMKSFANLAAFTTSKSTGADYFLTGSVVYLQDIARFVEVLTSTTGVTENTDWNYIAGANLPLGGAKYYFNLSGTADDSFLVTTLGGVDINAAASHSITLDQASGGYLHIATTGAVDLEGKSGQLTKIAAQGSGNLELDAASGKVLIQDTTSTAVDSIKLDSTLGGIVLVTEDATKAITMDSGSFSIDGVLASNVTTTGADLTISTITSGAIDINSASTTTIQPAVNKQVDITTTGTGYITLTSAVDVNIDTTLDMNGNFDQTGNYTFTIDSSSSSTSSVSITTDGGVVVDATKAVVIDAAVASRFTTTAANLTLSTVTSGTLAVTSAATLDMNAVAATLDATGGFSIDGSGAVSNVSSTGQALTISTITSGALDVTSAGTMTATATGANATVKTVTSGDVALNSAGAITFKDAIASTAIPFSETSIGVLPNSFTSILGALKGLYDAQQGANTLDEIYDGESGTRTITQDNGSVTWNLSNTYYHQFAGSGGAAILKVTSVGTTGSVGVTGDITATGGVSFTTSASTKSFNVVGGSNAVVIDGGAISIDGSVASNLSTTAADLTVSTITSGTLYVTAAAALDIDAAANSYMKVTGGDLTLQTATSGDIKLTSIAAISMTGAADSKLEVAGGDITLKTTGSTADIFLTSNNAITGTAKATSSIMVTGANLTIGTVTTGELYFDDARTAAIPFSDSTTYVLPSGTTSILGAIKQAFEAQTDVAFDYAEVTASSTDVTNTYVVVTIDLPTTGTFPMTPSALRSNTPKHYYAAVYLNGLRLNDAAWNYNFSTTKRIHIIDPMVAGDIVMIELKTLADASF